MPTYNISDQNDRWLQEKNGPDSLVLDDGSVWMVVPPNAHKVERWVRFSSLSVICDQEKAGGRLMAVKPDADVRRLSRA